MHAHKAFRLLLTILAVVIRSSSAAAFLIDGVTVEPSPQGGQTEIRGAAELVSALLRHQVYLLNTSQRATLGEIDRQFREFQSRGKKSTPVGSDLEFARLRKAAGEELLELLNSIPSVVRASVIDNLAKTTRTEPVTLPGDAGALLLRIQSGDEETRCETLSYDLSGAQDAIRFEVVPSGVTWALIDLSHVPAVTLAAL